MTTLFSKAASRASTLPVAAPGKVDDVGVMPVTSRRPPLAPKADVKLVLLTIPKPVVVVGGAAVLSLVHLARPGWVGTAGGMGRIEFVRLGGEPGSRREGVFCRAESSQEDLVGDQRLRERESVEVEWGRRWGGVVGDLGDVGGGEEMGGEVMGGEWVSGSGDLRSSWFNGGVLWGGGMGICSCTLSSGSGDGCFVGGVGSSIGLVGCGLSLSSSASLNCGFLGLRLPVEVTLPPKLR